AHFIIKKAQGGYHFLRLLQVSSEPKAKEDRSLGRNKSIVHAPRLFVFARHVNKFSFVSWFLSAAPRRWIGTVVSLCCTGFISSAIRVYMLYTHTSSHP
ncbi:unnamed protein product, partial [Ixodes hexagonus]